MNARRLDRLFERFRRKGDVQALGEVFDAAAPELYRVAVHLTRNLHQAEDLVQSTFLAAIEARGSYDSKRELLPWLLGILTRKAVWERRKLSRVIEPDRLEAHVAEEPSSEAESRELSKSVEDAVEQLPAPYREVLVAHLRAGKSPQEIAFELGRAPGTVRVQLHRGLELLRRALPVGLTMGVAITALSPRGWAAIRAAVLSSAASVAAGPVGIGVAASTGWIGGIAMGAKIWIAAAGLLAAMAWLGFQQSRSSVRMAASEPPLAAVGKAPPILEGSAPTELELGVKLESDPQRVSVERQPRPGAFTATSVSGRLLFPDGTPAKGAIVGLLRRTEAAPREAVVEGATKDDGGFDLLASPGAYYLAGLAEDLLPITQEVLVLPGTELQLEPLTFAMAAHLRGFVSIAGTSELGGYTVSATLDVQQTELTLGHKSLLWMDGHLCRKFASVLTNPIGRFCIEGLEPLVYHVTIDGASRTRIIGAAWDIQASADALMLAIDYGRIVVHVECEDRPLDAQVSLQERKRANGNRTLQEKQAGFLAAAAAAHGAGHGGTIWGLGWGSTIEALVPPGTAYLIKAEKEGYVDNGSYGVDAPAAGKTIERTLELRSKAPPAGLLVSLVVPDGSKIESAGFALFRTAGGLNGNPAGIQFDARPGRRGTRPDLVRNISETEGTFEIRDLPPGSYELEVRPNGDWDGGSGFWFHEPITVELRSGEVASQRIDVLLGGRLRVQCSNTEGAWLPAQCQVFDATGKEIPIAFFTRNEGGSTWSGGGANGHAALNASAPGGSNEVASILPTGTYDIRLSNDDYVALTRPVTIEAGQLASISAVLEHR